MSERPDYQEPVPDDAEYPAAEDHEAIPEGSDEIVDPLDGDEETDAPLEDEEVVESDEDIIESDDDLIASDDEDEEDDEDDPEEGV